MKRKLVSVLIIMLMFLVSFGVIGNSISTTEIDEGTFVKNLASESEKKYHRVGTLFPEPDPPIPAATFTSNIEPPNSWDWRDASYAGKSGDWTSSVKDQADCGSCYAFATLGSLESAVTIGEKNPSYSINLAEQYIVSCGYHYNSYYLHGCYGGNIETSFEFVKEYGAIPESKFDYDNYWTWDEYEVSGHYVSPDCSEKEEGWKSTKINIKDFGRVEGTDSIKHAIVKYGPVASRMTVYGDFCEQEGVPNYPDREYWPDNVYYHRFGEELGLHAVIIVGYEGDSNDGYWICKNSWGKGWGLNKNGEDNNGNNGGWFKIKYDECGIGEYNYYYSHLGNEPECYGGFFSDISGEWMHRNDEYGDYAIHMSKEEGACSATYEFDIGTNYLGSDLKVGIYFRDWAANPLAGGPNLKIYNYKTNNWYSWNNVGDHDDPKWIWKTISSSGVNNYINEGKVKVMVCDDGEDHTVLYRVGLKFSVQDPSPEPEVSARPDSIALNKVAPDSEHTKYVYVDNRGESGTELYWKIETWGLDWGRWSFNPSSEEDLSTYDGETSITVSITTPNVYKKTDEGYLKIYNYRDRTDYDLIRVEVSTKGRVKTYTQVQKMFFEKMQPIFTWLNKKFDLPHQIFLTYPFDT